MYPMKLAVAAPVVIGLGYGAFQLLRERWNAPVLGALAGFAVFLGSLGAVTYFFVPPGAAGSHHDADYDDNCCPGPPVATC
jgi:hypothetical protein